MPTGLQTAYELILTRKCVLILCASYPDKQEDRCTGSRPQTVGNHYSDLYLLCPISLLILSPLIGQSLD